LGLGPGPAERCSEGRGAIGWDGPQAAREAGDRPRVCGDVKAGRAGTMTGCDFAKKLQMPVTGLLLSPLRAEAAAPAKAHPGEWAAGIRAMASPAIRR